MPGHLAGKVALVTGGASGIGRATALTFAREGAKLVIADLHEAGGQQTVHLITEQGGEALFVKTDVSKAVEAETLISKGASKTWGCDYPLGLGDEGPYGSLRLRSQPPPDFLMLSMDYAPPKISSKNAAIAFHDRSSASVL